MATTSLLPIIGLAAPTWEADVGEAEFISLANKLATGQQGAVAFLMNFITSDRRHCYFQSVRLIWEVRVGRTSGNKFVKRSKISYYIVCWMVSTLGLALGMTLTRNYYTAWIFISLLAILLFVLVIFRFLMGLAIIRSIVAEFGWNVSKVPPMRASEYDDWKAKALENPKG
jgi:hypothetical protein